MPDLDNISKRGSSINFILPWKRSLPIPDGVVDQGDRQHTIFAYSGILAGLPSTRRGRKIGMSFHRVIGG